MLFQNTLITTLQYEIYSCNPLPYGSSSIQHLNSHLHFVMLLKIFEVLITNFMNTSNHIFSAHEIIQYRHLVINPDLVHNIHGTVIYICEYCEYVGTTVAQWLRCCTTNWKVASLIPGDAMEFFPDGVMEFFIDLILPNTMDLGSTQPLTEMSTRIIFWGYMRLVLKADNLTTFVCRFLEIWVP